MNVSNHCRRMIWSVRWQRHRDDAGAERSGAAGAGRPARKTAGKRPKGPEAPQGQFASLQARCYALLRLTGLRHSGRAFAPQRETHSSVVTHVTYSPNPNSEKNRTRKFTHAPPKTQHTRRPKLNSPPLNFPLTRHSTQVTSTTQITSQNFGREGEGGVHIGMTPLI